MERRDALLSLAAASAAAAVPLPAEAAEETVEYLFVQSAGKVDLADGVLRLDPVNRSTLYFSDRPQRIVGRVTTEEFVAEWAKGNDNFKADPPNATLSVLDRDQPVDVVVVLKSPRIEGDALVYDVEVLDGSAAVSGGPASLFIDIIGRPLTPLSYAGVARRTTRRMIWR